MNEVTGILLCAGDSRRMGFHKLLYRLPNGKTPLSMSLEALINGGVTKVVIVVNEATKAYVQTLPEGAGLPITICDGGATRQESVYLGLQYASPGIVVIHDAARCLTRPKLVQNCIDSALLHNSGVAAIPIRDTVLHVLDGGNAVIPLPREEMLRVQTPQAFEYASILAAYELARSQNRPATDDSTLYAAAGNAVRFVRGHPNNRKLTTPDDLAWLEEHLFAAASGLDTSMGLRVGYGEDVHLLKEGYALVLGGVNIPFEKGLLGHSDADVLTHALIDSLLGAAGLGDIGRLFPDTDARYKGISSMALLMRVVRLISSKGFAVRNVDVTVIAERPRLAQYFPEMRDLLSAALHIQPDRVSLKATTTEGAGPEGRGECMRASAVALLYTV